MVPANVMQQSQVGQILKLLPDFLPDMSIVWVQSR